MQLKKIENEEPGYDEDFITPDRIDLYHYRLALEKQVVFELVSLGYKFFTLASERERVLEIIQETVSLIEGDGIGFEFTQEELGYLTRETSPYRPKLP